VTRLATFPFGIVLLVIPIPYHEWLIGAGLYPLADAHRAAGLLVAGIALLLGALRLALGSWPKAATLALLAVFPIHLQNGSIVTPAIIGFLISILALFARRIPYDKVMIVTNVFGTMMLGSLLPVYQQAPGPRHIVPVAGVPLPMPELVHTPSIVHVVLDGYGAPEVLERLYDHDTAAFRSALEARGFVIFEDVRTPFNQTLPAMASVMSGREVSRMETDSSALSYRRNLGYTVRSGPVPQTFLAADYTLAASSIGYGHLDASDSVQVGRSHLLTDLEAELLPWSEANRAARHLASLKGVLTPGTLDALPQPFFYYQHLLAPHPPFTVSADGSLRQSTQTTIADGSHFVQNSSALRAEYRIGYREKARFVEAALVHQLDGLPEGPMVVIIHGDHGPGAHLDHEEAARTCIPERMRTFLAVYSNLPEVQAAFEAEAKAAFSLVNIYRVLLSSLAGEPIPLVATRSQFLAWSNPGNATDVTDQIEAAGCLMGEGVPVEARRGD
jgi:hypothetical protein